MAGSSKTAIYAALVGNSLIAVTKFAAASITGSSAMMSEGIHSLVDTGNQLLLLYGIKRSNQPASSEFPFGHGKEIYFWSFVVAMMIFALGGTVSVYKGWQHLAHPNGELFVIGEIIACDGMEEYGQPIAVEHQPGHKRGKQFQ